jgi:mono/diheme cytochrome c family protein
MQRLGFWFVSFLTVVLLAGLAAGAVTVSGREQRDRQAAAQARTGGDLTRSEAAIRQAGCGACHVIPGIKGANGNIGPPLDHWGKRGYIAGTLPNTPENLIFWLQQPKTVMPQGAMPNLGLSDEDSRAIAAYLLTLG